MRTARTVFRLAGKDFTLTVILIHRFCKTSPTRELRWVCGVLRTGLFGKRSLAREHFAQHGPLRGSKRIVQQNALQRQDIADVETSGQIYWQHLFARRGNEHSRERTRFARDALIEFQRHTDKSFRRT